PAVGQEDQVLVADRAGALRRLGGDAARERGLAVGAVDLQRAALRGRRRERSGGGGRRGGRGRRRGGRGRGIFRPLRDGRAALAIERVDAHQAVVDEHLEAALLA